MRRALALAAAVVAIVAVLRSGILAELDPGALRARIEASGALAPLVYMGMLVAGFFAPAPLIVLVAIGGGVFGGVRAFVYTWVAALVGSAIPFLLVRNAVGGWAEHAESRFPRLRTIDERLARHGLVTVVALRLMLYLLPPLNWALGATRVGVRDYVLGTALGIVPTTVLTAYLGDAITAAGASAGLVTPRVLVPAGAVLALLVGGAAAGRRLLGGAGRLSRGDR